MSAADGPAPDGLSVSSDARQQSPTVGRDAGRVRETATSPADELYRLFHPEDRGDESDAEYEYQPPRATDPSQGHGTGERKPSDPLAALLRHR